MNEISRQSGLTTTSYKDSIPNEVSLTTSETTGSLSSIDSTDKESLLTRFPGMKVLGSFIRSITSSIASAANTLGKIAWSAYNCAKVFIKRNSVTSTNLAAIETKYGKSLCQIFKQAFLPPGTVREGTTPDITAAFDNVPPGQEKSITILSPEIKSFTELGYTPMIIGDSSPDLLIPSGGYVHIAGKNELLELTDELLYPTTLAKQKLESSLHEANNNFEKAKSNLDSNPNDEKLLSEFSQAERNLDQLKEETEGYQTWPAAKLSAFGKMKQLLLDNSEVEVSKKKNSLSNELKQLKQKTDNEWEKELNNKIKEANNELATSKDEYLEVENDYLTRKDQRAVTLRIRKERVDVAEKSLKTLEAKSVETFKSETIQKKEDSLEKLTTNSKRILEETKDWNTWDDKKTLDYVRKESKAANEANLKFDRVIIKIEGVVIPCVDCKSYQENFNLLKTALEKLKKEPIPDDQVSEMIQLFDSDGLVGGFASGTNPKTGLLLGTGHELDYEQNTFEVKLTDEGEFDFHLEAARSYLTSLQIPIVDEVSGSERTITTNLTLPMEGMRNGDEKLLPNNHHLAPNSCRQFETRKRFIYRYTPPSSDNNPSSVKITDSRQLYYPVQIETLFEDEDCREAVSKKMNKPIANKDWALEHAWPDQSGPKLAKQFLESDLTRLNFYIREQNKATPLYERSSSNTSEVSTPEHEDPKLLAAAKKFTDFVGDADKAFLISQVVNQQVAVNGDLLSEAMKETSNQLQLVPYGSGTIATKPGATFTAVAFSKSKNGDITLEVKISQKPGLFMSNNRQIELNSEKSYVDMDYKVNVNFDSSNKLTLEMGPIYRKYFLEESTSNS